MNQLVSWSTGSQRVLQLILGFEICLPHLVLESAECQGLLDDTSLLTTVLFVFLDVEKTFSLELLLLQTLFLGQVLEVILLALFLLGLGFLDFELVLSSTTSLTLGEQTQSVDWWVDGQVLVFVNFILRRLPLF